MIQLYFSFQLPLDAETDKARWFFIELCPKFPGYRLIIQFMKWRKRFRWGIK